MSEAATALAPTTRRLAAAPGQPEPRHRLTPAWLLSQAGGSAEPAKATDAKCRPSARPMRGRMKMKQSRRATAGPVGLGRLDSAGPPRGAYSAARKPDWSAGATTKQSTNASVLAVCPGGSVAVEGLGA